MAVYRFKVILEDHEDIWREIEILSGQVFEKFHDCIQTAFKFDSKHAASFFLSDDQWRKGREITLREADLPLEETDIKAGVLPKKLMRDIKLAAGIKQPRQRFVYVFDPEVRWTFLIELIKLESESNSEHYPLVCKSHGSAPKQYRQPQMAKEELGPELMLAGLVDALADEPEDEDLLMDPGIPNEEGVNPDEVDTLQGEEGEEVEDENSDEFEDSNSDESEYPFNSAEEED